MISEDHVTEDWSNDAENSEMITGIKYITINYRRVIFNLKQYFTILRFLLYCCSNIRSRGELLLLKT